MTHDQLVRVFPNGRTVHVPSDGHPLPGYELALADIQRRGSSMPSRVSLAALANSGGGKPSFLARMFGAKDDEEEVEQPRARQRRPTAVAALEAAPYEKEKSSASAAISAPTATIGADSPGIGGADAAIAASRPRWDAQRDLVAQR